MLVRIYLSLVLFVALPVWGQTQTEVAGDSSNGTEMRTPPPVSGKAYSTQVGSEARSNYLHAGFTITSAYNDNVLPGTSVTPISDMSYSIFPTIALDQTTARLHQTFSYSPGFTFYQRTNSRNEADHRLSADFQYRLSPHITASLRDSFTKTSNVFGQPYGFSGAISGEAQTTLSPVIVPIANQIKNDANTEITYQFSRNGMVGGSGSFTNLHYPDPNQVPGLADSNSRGGAGFYSYRLSQTQYFGTTYQYSQIQSSLPALQNGSQTGINSETLTHAFLFFYTIYLKPDWSLSLSAGPQHYNVSETSLPATHSWAPTVMASMGWQGTRMSFATSYLHLVSGGGGLIGAFRADNANASVHWQLARTWTIGPAFAYANTKNVSQSMGQLNPGGHTLAGTFAMQHPLSNHFILDFGYQRLHQSYSSIGVFSTTPDSNREYISLSYQFTRPLGR